jgi:hypothetical protein
MAQLAVQLSERQTLFLLDLPEVKCDRSRTSEKRHQDYQYILIGLNFIHDPSESGKRTIDDFDGFALLKCAPGPR